MTKLYKDFGQFENHLKDDMRVIKYETYKFTNRKLKFKTESKCKESIKYNQTNPKYPIYNQIIYHAADTKDIERYGYMYLLLNSIVHKPNKTKIIIPKQNKNYNIHTVINTSNYMFNKLKKGCLVMIQNNKLVIFLPFSKSHYMNHWFKYILTNKYEQELMQNIYILTNKNNKTDKEKKELKHFVNISKNNLLKFINSKPQLKNKNIITDRRLWYANSCFFRNQSPQYEGDLHVAVYHDMLVTLLKERKVADCVFLMNFRDHPLIKHNGKHLLEPFELLPQENVVVKNKTYQQQVMCPVLSPCTHKAFIDIPIPTPDDWKYASKFIYPDSCINPNNIDNEKIDWNDKIDKVLFRGSATGCGITPDTNVRLKASLLSTKYPDKLDIGITSWNIKLKQTKTHPIDIINNKLFKSYEKPFISQKEKNRYKYILNLDGHVSAYRLGSELAMNSLVMLCDDSPYSLWFKQYLKPWKHYVPIKYDLSNLLKQTEWCIKHQKQCQDIIKNANQLHSKLFSKDALLNYMQELCLTLNSNMSSNFKYISKPEHSLVTKYTNTLNIISIFGMSNDNNQKNMRLKQRSKFLNTLPKILNEFNIKANITIIQMDTNQIETYKFNIGILKNIGFNEIKETLYDKDPIIFTDIDTLPNSKTLLRGLYNSSLKYPILISSSGTRYNSFAGACISFTKEQFQKCNGYPNNFFGWGSEDLELLLRIHKVHKYYCVLQKGGVIDLEEQNNTFVDVTEKTTQLKQDNLQNTKQYEYLLQNKAYWKQNGLSNISSCYKLIETEKHYVSYEVPNINIKTLHVELKIKDIDKFPLPKYNEYEFKTLKKQISNIVNNYKQIVDL